MDNGCTMCETVWRWGGFVVLFVLVVIANKLMDRRAKKNGNGIDELHTSVKNLAKERGVEC